MRTAGGLAEMTAVPVGTLVDLLAAIFRNAGFAEPTLEAREIVAALYDAPRFGPWRTPNRWSTQRFRAQLASRVMGAPPRTRSAGRAFAPSCSR